MSNEKLDKVEKTIFYRNYTYKSQYLNDKGPSIKKELNSKPGQF